jgi:3-oxoacyl-[acyl-carrier protein] reductase
VAIVTGASRGIGAQIARHLSARGMAIVVNYLRSDGRAAGIADEIRRAGGTAIPIRADVRDASQVAAMIERCVRELGDPGVLVNAAIGELSLRPAIELRWEDFLAQLDYHAKAVLQLCQAVYPVMRGRGGGAIVNLASQVVTGVPPAQMADYVTAKHALEGLSKALAAEWAGDGIRVNVVSPGLTRTELTQFHHERVFKAEALRTPLRRLATPDDIARAVGYLASDDGAFLTGMNLFVTGGQVML